MSRFFIHQEYSVSRNPMIKSRWAIFHNGEVLSGPSGFPLKFAYYRTKKEAESAIRDRVHLSTPVHGNGGTVVMHGHSTMHTEIYCTSLDNLDRTRAIRAIHQAYLQLRAIGSQVEDFNNDPAMAALSDCLKDAGHPGFAK